MKLGLGIDTGGTYTDAVIYDFDGGSALAWGKAPTTRENLADGIAAAMDTLPGDLIRQVGRVALSTTLATNACVEGRGGRSRLILIGCQRKIVERVGAEYGLPPVQEIVFIDGGHDRQGQPVAEPDWEALKAQIVAQDGQWDAYAVVEIWGARNQAAEVEAKRRIMAWTGKPVVAGHEITGELNSLKRAASALLNARLLPVIADFLRAVEAALYDRGVNCPVAIVRGDGTLMTRAFAAVRPIETLLCGPASSVLGGARLSGCSQGIVVDMGGTTSDIALIRDGLPVMAAEGAAVGGWRTGIASIDIETVGLGGDSLVRLDETQTDGLSLGPRRVIPLVTLAHRYDWVAQRLQEIRQQKRRHTLSLAEFYVRQGMPGDMTETQKRLWDALAQGPLSVQELAEQAQVYLYHLEREMEPMEQAGWVMKSGLTPTDALHGLGRMALWPSEAARDALEIMALQSGESGTALARRILEGVSRRLHRAVAGMLLRQRWPKACERGLSPQMELWIEEAFAERGAPAEFEGEGGFMQARIAARVPLIGVGAPIAHFLPDVAQAMGCEARMDPMSPVANAMGAITAGVTARVVLKVKPDQQIGGPGGYHVYGGDEKPWFAQYEQAVEWACQCAKRMAGAQAQAQGAGQVRYTQQVRERVGRITPAEDDPQRLAQFNGGVVPETTSPASDGILLETEIITRADGPMDWNRLNPSAGLGN